MVRPSRFSDNLSAQVQMLANACDSYDHLSALPVQMLRQVSKNTHSVGEVLTKWTPQSYPKIDPNMDPTMDPKIRSFAMCFTLVRLTF